jgi:hypothetical protein
MSPCDQASLQVGAQLLSSWSFYSNSKKNGVCSTSLRSLYLWCDMSTNQKYFPPDPAIFSPKNKIFILLYIVNRFVQNISIFHGKTARYVVLKIKFVDISHHRYKLRRDIEYSLLFLHTEQIIKLERHYFF